MAPTALDTLTLQRFVTSLNSLHDGTLPAPPLPDLRRSSTWQVPRLPSNGSATVAESGSLQFVDRLQHQLVEIVERGAAEEDFGIEAPHHGAGLQA